jgi:hypothetical protein
MRSLNTGMILGDRNRNVLKWVAERIVLVAVISIPSALALGRGAVLSVVALLLVILGGEVVLRLADGVAKPSSFCLPGFRESLRRKYFGIALLLGLGTSAFSLGFEVSFPWHATGVEPIEVSLHILAAFMLGMVACLALGAGRIILPGSVWRTMVPLAVLLPLAVPWVFPWALAHPFLTMLVCITASALVWFRLGDMARVKNAQRVIIEDVRRETTPIGITRTPPSPWIEALFRRAMERHRHLGVGRYIWGDLYETFGWLLSRWKWILSVVVILAVAADFVGSHSIEFLFISSGLTGALLLFSTSTLLTPGGRRERYWATLAIVVAGSLLLVGIATIITLLSEVVAIFLAAGFSWGNAHGLLSGTMGPAIVLLPCVVVPATMGVLLLGRRHERIGNILGGLVFISVFATIFWPRKWPDSLRLELYATVFVLGCVLFLFTLRMACRRWDLVGQRPARGN